MSKKKNKQKSTATEKPARHEVAEQIEVAFERGNYAAVRRIHASANALVGEDKNFVDATVGRVQLDMKQFLIGAGAFLIVLLVASLTLHTH